MNQISSHYHVDPRLTGKKVNQEKSIVELIHSTGDGRDVILNKLALCQPPIIRSIESFRNTREQIKQAKKFNSIPDGTLVNYFSFWSNFKPNWGGFIFNGVRI